MHPFIYVVAILVFRYCWNRYIRLQLRQPKSMKILAGIALVALVIFYIYRMVCYFPGESPMSYYSGNLLHTYKNFLANLFVQ